MNNKRKMKKKIKIKVDKYLKSKKKKKKESHKVPCYMSSMGGQGPWKPREEKADRDKRHAWDKGGSGKGVLTS
jgi:hypothetical protein